MRIHRIDTDDRRDVRQFINFPFELYEGCPQWVPPMISDMEFALDRSEHPFYRHSTADFFLAEADGQTLGRIAVIDNRNYNQYHQSQTAFFYFFETVEDLDVARALFEAASDWARGKGLEKILGPRGLLRADGMGILVKGFEHRPALGIPYNYPYYATFLEKLGFEKEIDHSSAHLSAEFELPQRYFEAAERVKERRGLRIESFSSKDEMRQWIPYVQRIYNEAFSDVWGFFPVTDAEIKVIADRFLAVADPRLIKIVMKDDEMIGFILAYPDISVGIQRAKGRFWPFGWFHLMREYRRTKWLDANGIGLLPGHQGVGANVMLYVELFKSAKAFGFEHADLAQVAETNTESLGEVNAVGAEWYKRHRVYRRAL